MKLFNKPKKNYLGKVVITITRYNEPTRQFLDDELVFEDCNDIVLCMDKTLDVIGTKKDKSIPKFNLSGDFKKFRQTRCGYAK